MLKFSKGKCKDLHLEKNNLMLQAGNHIAEEVFAEENLGVLVDKLNMRREIHKINEHTRARPMKVEHRKND